MPETPKQLKVFLCHSSQDKPVVRELYKKLKSESWIDPWLDEEKLLPGQDWDFEIEKAVDSSHAVLVFLTNNSVNKEGYVQRELRLILDLAFEKPEGAVFVIPIKLEDCQVPRRLQAWQWLKFFPASERIGAYEKIITSLKVRAKGLGILITKPALEEKKVDIGFNNQVSVNKPNVPKKSSNNIATLATKQVFISYSRNDVDFANKINNDLIQHKYKTWIDKLGIRSGDDWPDRIARAILDSSVVLVVVSQSALESTWVKRELSFADKKGKLVFPLMYKSCTLPHWFDLRFGNTQWADFTKGTYDSNLKYLFDGLKRVLK